MASWKEKLAKAIGYIKGNPVADATVKTALSFVPRPFSTFLQSWYDGTGGSKEDKTKEILEFLDKLQQENQKSFQSLSEEVKTQGDKLQGLMKENNLKLTDLVDKTEEIKEMLRRIPGEVADLVKISMRPEFVDLRLFLDQRLGQLENQIVAPQSSGQNTNKELEIKLNLKDANKAFYSGDFETARKSYEAVLGLDHSNVEALTAMGNVSLRRPHPDYEGALNYYEKALLIEPRNPFLLVSKGQALNECEKPISALNCMDQALQESPGYAAALIGKGFILTGLAKESEKKKQWAAAQDFYSQAISNYKAVLDVEPDNFYALFNLALVFEHQGRSEDAMSCLDKVPVEEVPNIEALYQCGLLFERARDYDKAGMYFDRVLSKDPRHVNANRKLAFALTMLGYVDKALNVYKELGDINPNMVPETRTEVFVCLAISNNDTKNMKTLAQKLGGPTAGSVNTYLASRLEAILGEDTKALDLLERVLNLDPRFKKLALQDGFFEKLKANSRFQELTKQALS